MREMGISKQSLYDTLGDKRSIFFRAMPRYRRSTNNSLREIFAREECVRDGFLKIFDSMILETKEQHQHGCLLMMFRPPWHLSLRMLASHLFPSQRTDSRLAVLLSGHSMLSFQSSRL